MQKKGGRAFPYLIYMNSVGDVVHSGFGRSVSAFAKAGEKASEIAKRLDALTTKAESGDMQARVELFILHLEMNRFNSFEKANEVRSQLKLNEEQSRAADQAMLDLELFALARKLKAGGEVVPRLIEIDASGLVPKTDNGASFMWTQLLDHWEEKQDAGQFEIVLRKLEKHFRGDQRFKMYRNLKRATLERMKKNAEESESPEDDSPKGESP